MNEILFIQCDESGCNKITGKINGAKLFKACYENAVHTIEPIDSLAIGGLFGSIVGSKRMGLYLTKNSVRYKMYNRMYGSFVECCPPELFDKEYNIESILKKIQFFFQYGLISQSTLILIICDLFDILPRDARKLVKS